MLKRVVSTWTATGCVQFSGGNVFARPGSKPESAIFGLMSAPTSCGHAAAIALVRVVPLGDRAFVVSVMANHPGLTEEEAIEHLWLAGGL